MKRVQQWMKGVFQGLTTKGVSPSLPPKTIRKTTISLLYRETKMTKLQFLVYGVVMKPIVSRRSFHTQKKVQEPRSSTRNQREERLILQH